MDQEGDLDCLPPLEDLPLGPLPVEHLERCLRNIYLGRLRYNLAAGLRRWYLEDLELELELEIDLNLELELDPEPELERQPLELVEVVQGAEVIQHLVL